MSVESAALLSSGLFAGSCLYIAVVGHPSRLSLPTSDGLAALRASLSRSICMQPILHTVSLIATIFLTWREGGSDGWRLLALGFLAPIYPLTMMLILPAGNQLNNDAWVKTATTQEVAKKMSRWGRLHSVRTILALGAFAALCLRV